MWHEALKRKIIFMVQEKFLNLYFFYYIRSNKIGVTHSTTIINRCQEFGKQCSQTFKTHILITTWLWKGVGKPQIWFGGIYSSRNKEGEFKLLEHLNHLTTGLTCLPFAASVGSSWLSAKSKPPHSQPIQEHTSLFGLKWLPSGSSLASPNSEMIKKLFYLFLCS